MSKEIKKSEDKLMKGLFRVIEGSSLVDMSVKEIEKIFAVTILTKFNPYPSQAHAKSVKPEERIYPDLCLEVEGEYDSMKKFSLATVGLK